MSKKAKIKLILDSCGGCPYRSEVFYSSVDRHHYSFCEDPKGGNVVAHGPPWTVPDDCPHLVKK